MLTPDESIPVERFDEVQSTSLLARQTALAGKLDGRPRLFIARQQTAGVGRFGRNWASPAGGLWFTIAWPIRTEADRFLDGLGLRLGIACAQAIERTLLASSVNKPVQLKWPNDVLIDGKKVAGLLTEVVGAARSRCALVGVGVNGNFPVNQLPKELQGSATTLREDIPNNLNLNDLFNDLCNRLRQALEQGGLTPDTLNEARHRLFGIGKPAIITLATGQTASGVVNRLDDRGLLVLDTDDGPCTVPTGAEIAQ
jgi:BirA family transcriptional regulator, biotin operon repressor / biotin---[acetyl-CoA-carboxylase] ligase